MGLDCGAPICTLCSYCFHCKTYLDMMISDNESAAMEWKDEYIKLNPGKQERCEEDKQEVRRLIQVMRESKALTNRHLMRLVRL